MDKSKEREFKHCLPYNSIFQTSSNDIDRYSLRLVGESNGTNDLPAVDMSNKVPIHCPQSEVTASASWNTQAPHRSSVCGQLRVYPNLRRASQQASITSLVKFIDNRWLNIVYVKLAHCKPHRAFHIHLETHQEKMF